MKTLLSAIFLIIISFNLSIAQKAEPTKLKAEVVSSTQVKFSWSGAMNDETYQLEVKAKTETEWSTFAVEAPSTNRRVSNLKAGINYEWRVMSVGKSKRDNSAYSYGENFATYSDCNSPEGISLMKSGIDYMMIEWEENGSAKYSIRIREKGTEEWNVFTTTQNSLRIENLNSYTEYDVQVNSFCKSDDVQGSMFSASNYFSTVSFLSQDFDRVSYSENSVSSSVKNAQLINVLGQVMEDIHQSCSSTETVYYDVTASTPSGIYVVQVPGTTARQYLFR